MMIITDAEPQTNGKAPANQPRFKCQFSLSTEGIPSHDVSTVSTVHEIKSVVLYPIPA